jgi:hypothetical protein
LETETTEKIIEKPRSKPIYASLISSTTNNNYQTKDLTSLSNDKENGGNWDPQWDSTLSDSKALLAQLQQTSLGVSQSITEGGM